MDRGAIAEINLSVIAYNIKVVKKISKDRPVIALVKADACLLDKEFNLLSKPISPKELLNSLFPVVLLQGVR